MNFLPNKDADLLSWSSNFSTKITATPVPFGLTAAQATAYAAVNTAYATAYATAITPVTRTKSTVAAKNAAKAALKANARQLARIVQGTPAVTPAQKIDLGLTPRDNPRSPIHPPTEAPVIEIASVSGRNVNIKLRRVDSTRRGKPAGCAGASLFYHVGAEPPADISAWTFEGSATRTGFTIEFAATIPAGSQVWITAFWYNPRAQAGPMSTPINTYVGGGVGGASSEEMA